MVALDVTKSRVEWRGVRMAGARMVGVEVDTIRTREVRPAAARGGRAIRENMPGAVHQDRT